MPRRSIGQLRRHFSIRERSTDKDNLGERLDEYTEQFKVWGKLRNGRQRNTSEGGILNSEDTLILTTHYRSGFKASGQQQAVDLQSNRVYRIDNPLDTDERRQWMEIVVVEQPVGLPQ